MKDKFWNFIIAFIGTPIIIILSIWSFIGDPILNHDAPSRDTIILILIGLVASLLALLIMKGSQIDDKIKVILAAVDNHTRVHNGKESSISQVDQMLNEAFQLLKTGKQIEIIEAHLEPNPPLNKGVLDSHLKIIQRAANQDFNLEWKIIIGHNNSNKSVWINNLVNNVQSISKGKYQVFELENAEPSLNFLVIKQLNQTYFGMGDWLGETCTGGVWISNQHLSDAMCGILKKLEDLSKER